MLLDDPMTLTAGEFLSMYFRFCSDGYVELTYLAPDSAPVHPHSVSHFPPLPFGNVPDSPRTVTAKNAQGYGVYFGTTVSRVAHPSYRRRVEADAMIAPALWADVDDVAPEEGYARLCRAPVPPSIVVASGGGVHGYWLLSDPVVITDETKEPLKRALHGLANLTGSDPKVRDLARIMRLPGTVNTKPGRNGARCEVIDCIPGRYAYEPLAAALRRHAPRETPRPTRHVPTAAGTSDLPRRVQDFLQHGAPAGSRNHELYVCACFYRDHGYTQMQAENDLAPVVTGGDFSHEEAMRTIASAYRAPAQTPLPSHMSLRMAMGDVKR